MLMSFIPSWARRVAVFTAPVSMRLGPDRLRALCEEAAIDLRGPTVALFVNRPRDSVLLYWRNANGDGTLLRKLWRGAFLLPAPKPGQRYVVLKPAVLPSLLRAK